MNRKTSLVLLTTAAIVLALLELSLLEGIFIAGLGLLTDMAQLNFEQTSEVGQPDKMEK